MSNNFSKAVQGTVGKTVKEVTSLDNGVQFKFTDGSILNLFVDEDDMDMIATTRNWQTSYSPIRREVYILDLEGNQLFTIDQEELPHPYNGSLHKDVILDDVISDYYSDVLSDLGLEVR